MPKRVHGRPPKAKSRPRRPSGARPLSGAESDGRLGPSVVAERGPAGTLSSSAMSTAPTTSPVSARRTPGGARRAPSAVINYSYLRRDVTTLSVLAPTMIVILVVAFFFLH